MTKRKYKKTITLSNRAQNTRVTMYIYGKISIFAAENYESNNTMENYLQDRHIGLTEQDMQKMVETIGVASKEELIREVFPEDIILPASEEVYEPCSETEYAQYINELAAENRAVDCFIGHGYYPTYTPAVIQRCVLENPVWYTSYTPYQAEISQGRLEALFIYQTMVSDMTGLPLANCSLLDEATAAAEAVTMMRNLRSREQIKAGVKKVFVDTHLYRETKAVLRTRAAGQGIELVEGHYEAFMPTEEFFGAIVQWPNANGRVEDMQAWVSLCHEKGLKVTIISDLMALALLKAPGSWGADICVGSAQHFGIPMGFGGPTAGFMATRDEYKRDMPGRIIGLSKDAYGKPAYRLALQTREQHIKREKATSNICTAEALTAMMAGFYAVYQGAERIRQTAENIHAKAVYLSECLQALGFEQMNTQFFDTLHINIKNSEHFAEVMSHYDLELYDNEDGTICLSIAETTNIEQMQKLMDLFNELANAQVPYCTSEEEFNNLWSLDEQMVREVDYLQAEVFKKYHTETEMMRYIKRLERKDISLTHSMIPLGSCTMKLNPAAAMIPLTHAGWANIHPMTKKINALGYETMLEELKERLCEVTGFEACTLQPTSGAAGEYTGLVIIREALKRKGETSRMVLLIPASAHGTNPASCVQAGFEPIVVKCDEYGNTDINDWNAKADEYSDRLVGCMITYPSTHGIFEVSIREMVNTIHQHGGLVYMDGANMNAQIGYTSPAYIGADVCHLNLHKTFASPHGGGGPGVGAVCCTRALKDCLPTEDNNRVSSCLQGNANMAIISYGYILMMGSEGLREATAAAILSANYLAEQLKDAYGVVYRGKSNRVGHELILDCRQFKPYGITETDVAKRLMDYGYHAPTLSFPVHGTLMIEPTESESLAELDRFIETMLLIRAEIQEVIDGQADKTDNVLLNAPHPDYELLADEWKHPYSRQKAAFPAEWLRTNKFLLPVARVDNGFGDRNLVTKLSE